MPELRVTFQADSSALLSQAAEQLARLAQPEPDFSITPAVRKTFHSLHGAAAMVGAQALSGLVEDFERLLEVAESFKLTARDQAQRAYVFLHGQLNRLRQAVVATLAGETAQVQKCSEEVHREALASWGGYFYSQTPDASAEAEVETHEVKPVARASRPGKSGSSRHGSDTSTLAREFLSSLGVPDAPASVPGPAPAQNVVSPTPAPAPAADTEQIDPEMLSYFVLETNESLAQMEALLLAWEKSPENTGTAYTIFRLVHTIKGAANSLGLNRIGKLLHGLEDLLESHVVDRVCANVSEFVELVLGATDIVKALVKEAQSGQAEPATAERLAALAQRVQTMAAAPVPPTAAPAGPTVALAPAAAASTPLSLERSVSAPAVVVVPAVSEATSAVVPATPAALAAPVSEPLTEAASAAESAEKIEAFEHQTIRVDSDRLDLLMNLIGELVISRSRLEKKLGDISRLKEEMFFGKSRLFQAITDFQERYEYSRPTLERARGEEGGAGAAMAVAQPQASALAAAAGANNLTGFSELEFDQYDEFNILARTLMEIGTDTGEIFNQLTRFFDAFGEETDQFSKITARLQDEITRVRMMPLTLLFQRLKRAARDAARKERKEIEFVTVENDTRLDKLIIDQLYTPLLHIVRNAVSHGIEPAAARRAAGKPGSGRIELRASCEANRVILEVSDDGAGLDLERIRAAAVKQGLLGAEVEADADTLTQFIFLAGFSTSRKVTDVSGRGIGLDVVRQEIARLSGSVHVRSTPGKGCTFVLHLPLTLAINQAMFFSSGGETCALPLNFVEHIQEAEASTITYSGRQELVKTPEGLVPLLRMDRLLERASARKGGAVVLARVADRRVALLVDRILRKQDIVVKPLGPLLRGHPLFSGATLAGDGRVVMIVDLPRLVQHEQPALAAGGEAATPNAPKPANPTQERPLILVVDDSLSVRKVIEKHLHSLQYDVELAVDGLDALEKLRAHAVSLVLTDLEMPRMHGFELIAEMRRQEALKEVPVIVVTSRDAEKHRRRATALGANDYIIKPFSREQLAAHIQEHLNPSGR